LIHSDVAVEVAGNVADGSEGADDDVPFLDMASACAFVRNVECDCTPNHMDR
jgi:hypothetical protein